MLKTLTKDDKTTTPYIATKDWNLSNVANSDMVLAEDGNPVAVEQVDYFFTYFQTSSLCSVAKEQQDNDLASFREGQKISGLFFPDADPVNLDGTYKRVIYNQIKTMFYNNYRDPTKMWGQERIDFDTSETKKFLSDLIKVFYVPTNIMGQKILEKSVALLDNTLDDVYYITDDGNSNLFAGPNLFSRYQILGSFGNVFVTGSSNFCNSYFFPTTSSVPSGSITLSVVSGSAIVSWTTDIANEDYWTLYRSIDNTTFTSYTTASTGIHTYTDTAVTSSDSGSTYWYAVLAVNTLGSSSVSNTASITFTSLPATASCITMSSVLSFVPINDPTINRPIYPSTPKTSTPHRLVVSDAGIGTDGKYGTRNNWFVNTDNNSVLNIYTASRVHFQSGKTFYYGDGKWLMMSDGTVAETSIPDNFDPINAISVVQFDSDGNYVNSASIPHLGGRSATVAQFGSANDYLWIMSQDGTSSYLEQYSPTTNNFISETTLGTFSITGSSFFAAHSTYYPQYGEIYAVDDLSNSIQMIFVNCIQSENGSGDKLEGYTITASNTSGSSPTIFHSGSINLLNSPYNGWLGGFAYSSLTQKVYVGTTSGSGFVPTILEINPKTFTTDFVYDLSLPPFNSNAYPNEIIYDDITKGLYFNNGSPIGFVGVIDPVLRLGICIATLLGSGAQHTAINEATGRMYLSVVVTPEVTSSIGIFQPV